MVAPFSSNSTPHSRLEADSTVAVFPSPNTMLSSIYGDTTGRRRFDPYLADWSDSIKDDRGRVRLHKARCAFLQGSFEFDDIKKAYQMWVGCDEYGKINVKKDGVVIETIISKLPKRGNDIYRWKLKKRLGFLDSLEDSKFFDPNDFDESIGSWDTVHRPSPKTKMLFVTLTWDPKTGDLESAWSGDTVERIVGLPPDGNPYDPPPPRKGTKPERVGDHYLAHKKGCLCVSCRWNRWISAMRKKYGKIKVFRNWEAFGVKEPDGKVHADGYPHIHAVLYFEDHSFTVSLRDRHNHFRITRAEKDDIANLWGFFVDVEACYSVQGAMGYIKKYLLKAHGKPGVENVHRVDSDTGELTTSLLWIFRKQSFAVSGGWSSDLITNGVTQTDISDFDGLEFEWVGVFTVPEVRAEYPDLDITVNSWSFVIPGG